MPPVHILPDVLQPGLKLVIVGSAAGAVSAARGVYYAGPGNKFWWILAATGLTPRQLDPAEFHTVLEFGIGLTDLVKTASGSDASLPSEANDVAGLTERIRVIWPRMVAFNGKRAAAVFLGQPSRDLIYGAALAPVGFPPVWILPSTSGAASGAWSAEPWHRLAEVVRG